MPYLLLALQLLTFAGIALAAARPGLRRRAARGLLGSAAAGLVAAAVAGSAERSLTVSHRFSAYVELAVRSKEFVIETTTAPGWQWGACWAVFCLGWAAGLRVLGTRNAGLGAPLLLAVTGSALQLVLQKAAAPAVLLAPFDLAPDRVLFPATVAAALLLGRPGRRILHLALYLVVFVTATRLPLAVFGTLATRGHWGTHLDVHGTTYFVPPGGGTSIGGIEVVPGSSEQLFWLVWAPQLVVYPVFYLMSTGGIAFLWLMWNRQRAVDAATSSSAA